MAFSTPSDISGLVTTRAVAPSNQIQRAATQFTDHDEYVESVEDLWQEQLDNESPYEDYPIENFADYIKTAYEEARNCRAANCIEADIIEGRRLWLGEYTPEELRKIPGIDTWFDLTKGLSNILLSFMRSILKADKDNPIWELETSPIPELPQFVVDRAAQYAQILVEQEAAVMMASGEEMTPQRAEEIVEDLRDQIFEGIDHQANVHTRNLQRKIADNLHIADFDKVFDQFLQDLCKDPVACFKGPYTSTKKVKQWKDGKIVFPETKYQRIDNVDVANLFPSVDSTNTQDGQYIIHLTQMTRSDLCRAMRLKGFVSENIETILKEFEHKSRDWLNPIEQEVERQAGQAGKWNDWDGVDVIEYHGKVPGTVLHHSKITRWDGKRVDPTKEYEIEAWLCCDKIIRAVPPCNPGGRPFHCASLYPTCGSFWGQSLPMRVRDEQRAANVALRATLRDMGWTSAPITNIDVSLLDDSQDVPEQMYGGMIIKTNSRKRGLAGNAINFQQIPSQANGFLNILDRFFLLAEQVTGINRQMLGQSQPGIGTLGEAQILQQNANTQIQSILVHVDCALGDLVEMMSCQIQMTTDDPTLKADARVKVNGATALLTRELQKGNLLQFYNTMQTAYQQQPGIVEPAGMVCLMRDLAKAYGQNPDKFVISEAEAKERKIELQIGQLQGGATGIAGGVAQPPQVQSPAAAQDSIQAPTI